MSQVWQTLSAKVLKVWQDVRQYSSSLVGRTTKFSREMIERVPWGHAALAEPIDGVHAAPLTGLHTQPGQQAQKPAPKAHVTGQQAEESAEDVKLAA